MVLPVPPMKLMVGVGLAVASIRQIFKAEDDAERFATMSWAEPLDSDEDEACVLLGEEDAPDGKTWFVCNEPSDDPNTECTKETVGIDAMTAETETAYLCKAPKVRKGD